MHTKSCKPQYFSSFSYNSAKSKHLRSISIVTPSTSSSSSRSSGNNNNRTRDCRIWQYVFCMHGVQKPWQACSFQHNSIPNCQGSKFAILRLWLLSSSRLARQVRRVVTTASCLSGMQMDAGVAWMLTSCLSGRNEMDAVVTWMLASCFYEGKMNAVGNMDVSILLIRVQKKWMRW